MFSVMSVCMSVSVCLSLSVCVSVCSGYNFWTTLHRDFILVCKYILTISRSSLSIKVIGSRKNEENGNFIYFNMLIPCIWLQVINKVKVIHQGEGHIKIKVKYLHPFKSYVAHTLCKWVVCIRLNASLFLLCSEKSHGHKLSRIRPTWNLVIWALNSS